MSGSTTTTGTGHAATSISVTPTARLARVVVFMMAEGVQVSNTSPLNIGAINYGIGVDLAGGSYGPRRLYKAYQALNLSATSFFNTDAAAGSRPTYLGYHSGGTQTLGCDLQTSYGDATHNAGTVTLTGGFFHIGTGKTNFVVSRVIVLRILEIK